MPRTRFLFATIAIFLILLGLAPAAHAQQAGVSYIVQTVAGSAPPIDAALGFVLVPRSLIGLGVVEVQMTVDGIVLNTVTITIL